LLALLNYNNLFKYFGVELKMQHNSIRGLHKRSKFTHGTQKVAIAVVSDTFVSEALHLQLCI